MKGFLNTVLRLDIGFQAVAGIGLAFMMLVTVADITMRLAGSPIVGSIELISFSGAVVIGFAIPYSSWKRSHVIVDFVMDRLSPRSKRVMMFCTKTVGLVLFLFIGLNFIIYGLDLMRTKEVSAGLRIPYYPITFGLALSCFLQSLTLFADLIKISSGGTND